jgi:hypothetical protein
MFWMDFSRTGIGAVVILSVGQSLNKEFFANTVLPSIVDDRALSCPKLKASGTVLHVGNAQPHFICDKYHKFEVKRLPHPPCSLDLAPCDFWLFAHPEHCLEGRFFDDDGALKEAVSEILTPIEPDIPVRVFAEWKHRLRQYIDQEGDYL